MVSVLITRPQAASENLAMELSDHGYDGIIEPLLYIEPTVNLRPVTQNVQAVMITSGNALDVSRFDGLSDLVDLPCFCVGTATSDKARAFGFHKIYNAAGDGPELARLIGSTLTDKKREILHIAGRDTDRKAQDELEQMGFTVEVWVVYVALAATELSGHLRAMIKDNTLNAVLLFSVRTAETLKSLLERYDLQNHCSSITALALSSSIGDALKSLPWQALVVASAPNEESLITSLKQVLPVS